VEDEPKELEKERKKTSMQDSSNILGEREKEA
jgi:hypothetical protein